MLIAADALFVPIGKLTLLLCSVGEVSPFATSYFKQYRELVKRQFKNQVRDPLASVVSLVQALVMAFIIGSIFYQLGYTQTSIQGRIGVLFFICVFTAFGIAQAAVLFIKSRLLVNRERASGVYHVAPYYLAKVGDETLCAPLRNA
jgi:hypothetical protein